MSGEKDENAVVLDFLQHGKRAGKNEPVAQVVGTEHFNLLEVVAREGERLSSGQKVYIGDGERDEVRYIKGKITVDDLTGNAKSELDYVLEDLIEENEERFVQFFNESTPITPRRHALEVLPSVGKKHMRKILDEREKEPFADFEDLQDRIDLLPDPRKLIRKRIRQELEGKEKRYLFTTPPKSKDKGRGGRRGGRRRR